MGASDAPHTVVAPEVRDALVACARTTPPGTWCEVGVFQGGTAMALDAAAHEQGRALYLFDTFSGIPWADAIDSHKVGDFADTDLEAVRVRCPHAKVVVGVFPHIARELEVPVGDVAFVHLDCDQYRSYQQSLEYFLHRMVRGGVIWCDDAPVLEGAKQAVLEFLLQYTHVKLQEHALVHPKWTLHF